MAIMEKITHWTILISEFMETPLNHYQVLALCIYVHVCKFMITDSIWLSYVTMSNHNQTK